MIRGARMEQVADALVCVAEDGAIALKMLFEHLALEYSVFNVFRYLSFRAICAVLTALPLNLLVGPALSGDLSGLARACLSAMTGQVRMEKRIRQQWAAS